MPVRVEDALPWLRGGTAKGSRMAPNRTLLLGGLIAASAYAPLGARGADAATHERRSPGVVMMIGGITHGDDTVAAPPRAAWVAFEEPSGDPGRRSVVIQPGHLALNDAVRQTSAPVASRVMALSPIIDEAAHVAEVDRALLMAVIDVESGGDPQAVSRKGATGLMQLMPATGARHGASDLFDPRQNITAGARYLKELMRQFGGLPLALAAYNAGEGAVQRYGGQIPPYSETLAYVPKVMARYRWYRDASTASAQASVQASVQAVSNAPRSRFLLVGSGGAD